MKLGVLLLLVVTLVQRSTATLTCDAVELESRPEPRCWSVPSPECVGVDQWGNSEADCHTETDACPASKLNYSKVVVDDNGSYSITGLPNFAEDSSYIGYCPDKPNDNWDAGGCLPRPVSDSAVVEYHVDDEVRMSYTPVDTLHYNITVGWTYPSLYPIPDGAVFRLLVKTPGASSAGHYYCVCINGTLRLTEHSLTVEYHPGNNRLNYIQASIVTFPHKERESPPVTGGSSAGTSLSNFPVNCSDYKNGLPYSRSRCAIPYYGRPRNLKVNVVGTVTRLSWDRPCYRDPNACHLLEMDPSAASQSDPDTYYLASTVDNITHYFIIHNTTAVVLHTTNLEDVKLYTQTPCSGACQDNHFANGCSEPVTLSDSDSDTCCEPELTTVPSVTSTPSSPWTSESTTTEPVTGPGHIIAAMVVVVLLVLLVAGGLITLVVVFGYCHYRRVTPQHEMIHPSPWPSPSTLVPSVLVVFSPRTNHDETHVILHFLVNKLADFNVEAFAYEMCQLRQPPTEWVVEQRRRADAVLCVCNREFWEDWNHETTTSYFDHTPKVVRTLKQLFEGDLQEGSSGVLPYGVIKMKPTDSEFVPPLLKSRPDFMYHQTKDIAHFAHNKPLYQ